MILIFSIILIIFYVKFFYKSNKLSNLMFFLDILELIDDFKIDLDDENN
jgi:hypothetical protein